jgi:hypothetical protein
LPSEAQHPDFGNRNGVVEAASSSPTLSRQRLQLLNWFRANAKPLAEAYEGAIRLLMDAGFPCRVHFIAHAVRDIANRLAEVLDPQSKGRRIEYHQELDRIEKLWPGIGMLNETDNSVAQDVMTIKYEVASIIDSLVVAHRKQRQEPPNSEKLFYILMRNEPTRADLNRRLVSDFEKMRKWFMSFAHLRDSQSPKVDEEELQSQFAKFEGILHSFVGDFFTTIAEIDEILQQANE